MYLALPFSRFEPWLGHCVVFLGKTLYSHSASLHQGVLMGPRNFAAWVSTRWTSIPSREELNYPRRFMPKKPG